MNATTPNATQNGEKAPTWLTSLKEDLTRLPKEIADQEQKVYDLSKNVQGIQQDAKVLEANLSLAVASETGPDNKAKYGNETARSAEVTNRKSASPLYKELIAKSQLLEAEQAQARVELGLLSNMFSSTRHLCDLYSAWLRRGI